jgi:capsular exopolysaccharide synthesis family protein
MNDHFPASGLLARPSTAAMSRTATPGRVSDDVLYHEFRGWRAESSSASPDLGRMLAILLGRKRLIAAICLGLTALVALIVTLLPPVFSAAALVKIEPRSPKVVQFDKAAPGVLFDDDIVESEVRVIASPAIAASVIEKLRLSGHSEINPDPDRPIGWSQSLGDASVAQTSAGNDGDFLNQDPSYTRLVETFLRRLTVAREGKSRVISIAFESRDPAFAARVANAVAESYLEQQLRPKLESHNLSRKWLDERLQELRAAVKRSEESVDEYRRSAGMIRAGDSGVLAQQLEAVNTELTAARSKRMEAQAMLGQLRTDDGRTAGIDSAPLVLASPVIGVLRAKEAELQHELAQLKIEYGSRHPQVLSATSELADLQTSITREIARIRAAASKEYQLAQAKEDSLSQTLGSLEDQATDLSSRSIELRALERETEANRRILEDFLGTHKQLTAFNQLERADAMIVSPALTPSKPAFPQKKKIVALAFLLSFATGVAVALLLEHLNQGFRTAEEVERETGLSVLSVLPAIRRPLDRTIGNRRTTDRDEADFVEAMFTLVTRLSIGDEHRGPRALLFTSALPQEGKTTLALALARMLAAMNHKVVLIDADLRRPGLADLLGASPAHTLADVLAGTASPDQALWADPASHVRLLLSKPVRDVPDLLLNADSLPRLIDRLKSENDFVLIDSPPVLAVSDAEKLSGCADETILLVKWRSTRRTDVKRALAILGRSEANVSGFVLNHVDYRKSYYYRTDGYSRPHVQRT